jgi:hypothetical protein
MTNTILIIMAIALWVIATELKEIREKMKHGTKR